MNNTLTSLPTLPRCVQAMDRCHRIGQNKPVLVFRLATSNSVEGKMLRRACDKMALERLVIKKGVFKEVLDTGKGGAAAVRIRVPFDAETP